MTTHFRLVSRVALLLLLLTPVSAFAQQPQRDVSKIGLAVGNNVVSIIWQPTERLAFRPDMNFATSNTTNSAIGSETSSFQSSPGFSALFYIGKWEALRTYVTPRYGYSRISSTNTNGAGVSTTSVNSSHSVSGSLGAQYSMNPRFGVFGELGLNLGFSSQGTISSHNSSLRSTIGGILFF